MDYKEKLEEAKKLYKTANADQKYALELLFPEIKENEEERIRKTLIEYFNAYPKDYFGGLKKSYIVAWLEKQGDQNKIEALRAEYEKGRADTIGEMKSSWSEEDEKNLIEIINIVQNISSYDKQYDRYINWLKSIRPKPHWKPTNEQKEALRAAYTVGNIQNIQWAIMPLKTLYKQLNTL